jgi:23S rRNA (guanosine2251-2'-O)-methyltransferase
MNKAESPLRFIERGRKERRRSADQPKKGASTETIYGIHAVEEALGERAIDYVLIKEGPSNRRVQEIINRSRTAGISVRFAPRQALERAAGTAHHQDVVAVCSPKAYVELGSLLAGQTPLLVALDGVEDPRNLGAVARAALAAGADGLVIPERRSAAVTPVAAAASAGALERLKVARVSNLVRALVDLKKSNLWIYGFEPQAAKTYHELDYHVSCVLVFGGEGRGLHRLVREAADELARIPLHGPVESLNVAVAAGIVLFEAARQRGA